MCAQLYEEDAQIGADVLGWKLTLTGVGACRQARPSNPHDFSFAGLAHSVIGFEVSSTSYLISAWAVETYRHQGRN